MKMATRTKCYLGAVLLALAFIGIAQLRATQSKVLPPLPADADFSRGPTAERKVALTFDADQATAREEILDILKTKGVKATFFFTGRFIKSRPELVRRLVRDGHEIGNHTYNHPHLTRLGVDGRQRTLTTVTKQFLQDELLSADRLYREVTGKSMVPLWRAPFGEHNGEIRRWATELGYQHVGWTQNSETAESLDSLDWVSDQNSWLYFTAKQIRRRILKFGDTTAEGLSGGILLFHLGSNRTEDRVDRELPAIIDGLREQGYEIVPVSELWAARLATSRRGRLATDGRR